MALKDYSVVVNNMETILQLDEKDAEARGLTDKNLVSARRTATADLDELAAEQDAAAAEEADAKAAAPANKSRTAANK